MKSKLLFLFLTFSSIVSISAQVRYGLRAGVALSQQTNSPFIYLDTGMSNKKWLTGIDIAGFIEIPIAGKFSLQPEVHFMNKGQAFEEEVPLQGQQPPVMKVETRLIYEYIEVPVLAKLLLKEGKTGLAIFGGPSLGYALAYRLDGDIIGTFINGQATLYRGDNESLPWNLELGGSNPEDIRFDLSGALGVAFHYNLGKTKLILDIRYLHDFNNWKEYQTDLGLESVYNRNLAFSFGISF